MSKARFTPGPWEIGMSGGASIVHYDGDDVKFICVHPANPANTKLIIAAPDLYAALKACEQRLADLLRSDYSTKSNPAPQDEDDAVRAARAALAKARGE